MIELFYPYDIAPLIGVESESAGVEAPHELLPVVDENGIVVGRAPREFCHTSPERPLHPVVHMEIVDRYSRFFLQRRSASKETYPLCWDVAVGGHAAYGELYDEALVREAGEELGFFDYNPMILDNYIYADEHEREMVNLYVTIGSFDIHPDNYEVCDGRYWTTDEIESMLGKGTFTPAFENEYRLYRDKILALL